MTFAGGLIGSSSFFEGRLTCLLGEELTSSVAKQETKGPIMVNASELSHFSESLQLSISTTE